MDNVIAGVRIFSVTAGRRAEVERAARADDIF